MAHDILQCQITNYTPYLALTGELWCVFCENLNENWLHYNGTALYLIDWSSLSFGSMDPLVLFDKNAFCLWWMGRWWSIRKSLPFQPIGHILMHDLGVVEYYWSYHIYSSVLLIIILSSMTSFILSDRIRMNWNGMICFRPLLYRVWLNGYKWMKWWPTFPTHVWIRTGCDRTTWLSSVQQITAGPEGIPLWTDELIYI